MREIRWERMFPDQLEAAFEGLPAKSGVVAGNGWLFKEQLTGGWTLALRGSPQNKLFPVQSYNAIAALALAVDHSKL